MDKPTTRPETGAVRRRLSPRRDIYIGTREELLAAGVLRAEWIPVKTRQNASVATRLDDGREVRVYKKGARLEVRIDIGEEERAARSAAWERELAAEEIKRAAETERLRGIVEAARANLRGVVDALAKRYPRVRVTEAEIVDRSPGICQSIALRGTVDDFLAAGLLTPGMLSASRQRDQRRISRLDRYTPTGCAFMLFERGDQAELRIFTASEPCGPDRFALDDARRELARIFGSAAPRGPRARLAGRQ